MRAQLDRRLRKIEALFPFVEDPYYLLAFIDCNEHMPDAVKLMSARFPNAKIVEAVPYGTGPDGGTTLQELEVDLRRRIPKEVVMFSKTDYESFSEQFDRIYGDPDPELEAL